MIQTILQNITVIGMLADRYRMLAISPDQEQLKGNPDNRGVILTPQTAGGVGLYRLPARIPNISKRISFQTTGK